MSLPSEQTETLTHLFWNCRVSQLFWNQLETYVIENVNAHLEPFTVSDIIFCNPKFEIVLNRILLLAKKYLYNCRLNLQIPPLLRFKPQITTLQEEYPAVLTIPILSLSKQDFTKSCENSTSEIQIKTTIPQLDQGKELDASIRCSLALVNIAENYPPEKWTRVYTDGSVTKATTYGGAGITIQYPSGATQTASSATGKHCTNYRAETEALKQAATLVKDSLEPCCPTVFLTDALSVLEALQTNRSPLLATQMQELGNTCRVVLQ